MAHCSCIGKKVVRALYNYAPSVVAGGDEAENDLNFNKGDVMIVIKEYVCLSVHVYVCVCVCVCVCVSVSLYADCITQTVMRMIFRGTFIKEKEEEVY